MLWKSEQTDPGMWCAGQVHGHYLRCLFNPKILIALFLRVIFFFFFTDYWCKCVTLLAWSQLTGRGIILPGSVLATDSCLAKDCPQGSLHLMTGLLGGIGSSMLAPFHDNSERSSELQNSPVVIWDLCWGDIALWLPHLPLQLITPERALKKSASCSSSSHSLHSKFNSLAPKIIFLDFLVYVCVVGRTQTEKILYLIVNFPFISLFSVSQWDYRGQGVYIASTHSIYDLIIRSSSRQMFPE